MLVIRKESRRQEQHEHKRINKRRDEAISQFSNKGKPSTALRNATSNRGRCRMNHADYDSALSTLESLGKYSSFEGSISRDHMFIEIVIAMEKLTAKQQTALIERLIMERDSIKVQAREAEEVKA